jgi:hypothetical protein
MKGSSIDGRKARISLHSTSIPARGSKAQSYSEKRAKLIK